LASKGGQSINIRAGLLNKHGPPSAADVWNCRPCSVVKKPVQYIRMQQQAAAGSSRHRARAQHNSLSAVRHVLLQKPPAAAATSFATVQ
jgi:hypothetical protein